MPRCTLDPERCTFEGTADEFKGSMGVYHDMRCPKCGTTHIDTSDVNAKWAAEGRDYGYGDNNVLKMETT